MKRFKIILVSLLGTFSLSHGIQHISMKQSELVSMTIPNIMNLLKAHRDGTPEYIVGLKFLEGIGVSQDYSIAFKQFLKAAVKGHPPACYTVAQMYFNGQGTPRNDEQGVHYMRKAAELGQPKALYNYSVLLVGGRLVERDLKQAVILIKRAADKGDGDALAYLGVRAREGLDDQLENTLEPNYETAFDYFKKAAAEKSYAGMFNLAQLYSLGLGVKKNNSEAKKLFDEILKSSDEDALVFKGLMYETGSGVAKNLLQAQKYYKLSAENPHDLLARSDLGRVNEKILRHAEKARALEAASASLSSSSAASAKRKDKGKAKAEVETDVVTTDDESEIFNERDIDIGGLAVKDMLNTALQYDDKSVVADVDTQRETITINNPFDGSVITLKYEQHKKIQETTKKLQKFNYDARIQQWFGPQPETLSAEEQKTLARHRFAQRMDEIIQIYGAKAYFVKQDGTLEKNKTIEGSIKTKNNGVLEGTFEYAYYKDKDKRKILYHRFLHPHSKAVSAKSKSS